MKASVILVAGVLGVFAASDARAQEGAAVIDSELARVASAEQARVPTMVIVEATSPLRQAKSASAAPKPIVFQPGAASDAVMQQSTGNAEYDKLILDSAARNGVDPNLMVAVMRQESGFNPRARSYKGASGLMQLMPATARRFGVTSIYDPKQNIEGGARYLRFLLDKFNGDVKLVLAGYNAGENAVIGAGYQVPRYRETQAYVRNISARYGSATHRGAIAKKPDPKAPQAIVLASESSNRLSNNY